jgi:hypothetical protein
MKKITFKSAPLVILLMIATLFAAAQSVETRQVSNFNGIAAEGPFNVHINIDGTESVKISTEPDIIKVIETVVENGTLKIKFKDHLQDGEGNTSGPIDIYVSAKTLTLLVKNGSGSITVDKGVLTGTKVNIVLTGSGSITSPIKSESLNTVINGSGSVALNGATGKSETTINGPGSLNSRHLEVKDASVLINGSGNAYFIADNSISAHVNGSGNVIYSGNATVTGGIVNKVE